MNRRERLRRARLYLVLEGRPGGRGPEPLLRAALEGGVDMVQLRDKEADDESLLRTAAVFRRLCDEQGALFWVNDRPDIALAARADGVHVGQDDAPVERVREEVGPDVLVGLSTHTPEQVDAAQGVDYIAVGPVHATPTKPGRPAAGLELVRHAAAHARVPWFAIGGLDPRTLPAVVAAGARRAVVVRAIPETPDPRAAAAALRAALEEGAPVGAA
jgi:thiamine-phosphate pyrophosphorylase